MKKLLLTRDKVALVDDEDYYWLSQWNWFAVKIKNSWYARRNKKKGHLRNTDVFEVYLHRVVARVTDKNLVVDHRDHNPLNNQKSNLRICTSIENKRHVTSHRGSSSVYLGVSWDKSRKKWQAAYMFNGKRVLAKRFETEIEAAKAYDIAALNHAGDFANLNFK